MLNKNYPDAPKQININQILNPNCHLYAFIIRMCLAFPDLLKQFFFLEFTAVSTVQYQKLIYWVYTWPPVGVSLAKNALYKIFAIIKVL